MRLLPEVARRLLGGDPPRTERNGYTWRYGTHGSLAVHVGGDRAGTWRDFEAGKGGGTLDLVQHVLQRDKAAALRWLEDEELIERRAARGGGARVRPPAPQTLPPQPTQPSRTAHLVDPILRASVPADDTLARNYLARRGTWPPLDLGPNLPTAVRYVDANDVPEGRRKDGTTYRRIPAAAAGCVVFKLTDPAGERPSAASLEAVAADGRRLDWCGHERWRRTYGSKAGLVFEAKNDPDGYLWLVEGECDALALVLCRYGGCVRSVGGTAGFRLEAATDPERRPLVIVADSDAAGARAASRLRTELLMTNERSCAIHYLHDGDVADDLAYWVNERAAIRADAGVTNEFFAWQDVLIAIEHGGRLIDHEFGFDGGAK